MCRGNHIVPASTCSCASACQYPNFDCSVILDSSCNYTPLKLHCVVLCAKLTIIHNSDHSSVIILRRFACARSPGTTTNLWSYWFLYKLRQLARSENKARILYTFEKTLFWSLKTCTFEKFAAALHTAKSSGKKCWKCFSRHNMASTLPVCFLHLCIASWWVSLANY